MSYLMLVQAADRASSAFLSPKTRPALRHLRHALTRELCRRFDREDIRLNDVVFDAVERILVLDGFMVGP